MTRTQERLSDPADVITERQDRINQILDKAPSAGEREALAGLFRDQRVERLEQIRDLAQSHGLSQQQIE